MPITTTVRKNNSSGDILCSEGSRSTNSSIIYNGSLIQAAFSGAKTCNCKDKIMRGNLVIGGKTLNCKDKMMPYNIHVQNAQTTPTIYSGAFSRYDTRSFTVRNSDGSGTPTTKSYPCARISGDVKSGYYRPSSGSMYYGVVINDNEVFLRSESKIATIIKSGGYTYLPYIDGWTPGSVRLSVGNQIVTQLKTISSDTKVFSVDGVASALKYIDIPANVICGAYWGDKNEAFFAGDASMVAPMFGFGDGYVANVIKENGHTYIPVIKNTTSIYYAQFVV